MAWRGAGAVELEALAWRGALSLHVYTTSIHRRGGSWVGYVPTRPRPAPDNWAKKAAARRSPQLAQERLPDYLLFLLLQNIERAAHVTRNWPLASRPMNIQLLKSGNPCSKKKIVNIVKNAMPKLKQVNSKNLDTIGLRDWFN